MRKPTLKSIQKKIWLLLKEKTIEKYGNRCYTCGASNLEGANCQLGHMWAKASLSAHLKYDPRVLRIQCFRCNINFGGQGAIFYANMLKEIGAKKMKELEKEKQILVKADLPYYLNLYEKLNQS